MDAEPHLLLVAGPGLGHISGCLLLAKALLQTGLSITLAWFAKSYRAQQKRLPAVDPAIRFEILEDGSTPGSENYKSLFAVTPEMQDGLAKLVERRSLEKEPVCCIVSDTFMPWTQDVADRFQIPRVDYWASNATSYSTILALPELVSKGFIPMKDYTTDWISEKPIFIDFVIGYPQFPLDEFPKEVLIADLSDPFVQPFYNGAAKARKAERVLIHSLYDLESNAFEGLRESQYRPYAIGPLLPYASESTNESSDKPEFLRWLDTQAEASVMYVSFGSNEIVLDKEIVELAAGLEASGRPFLWVVRTDQVKGELSDLLPEGFEARTKERGRIVPWVPQVAVLGHPAVGGFLTHCGWNSTLESMWMGVPMLGCPRRADQRTNARFIEERWGLGIEMGRTKNGSFERADVEQGVKALMIGKEGRQARSKAQQLREAARKTIAPGGDSHNSIIKFADDMRALSKKNSTSNT